MEPSVQLSRFLFNGYYTIQMQFPVAKHPPGKAFYISKHSKDNTFIENRLKKITDTLPWALRTNPIELSTTCWWAVPAVPSCRWLVMQRRRPPINAYYRPKGTSQHHRIHRILHRGQTKKKNNKPGTCQLQSQSFQSVDPRIGFSVHIMRLR